MPMGATDTSSLPLVDLRAVSDRAHQWVAVSARMAPVSGSGALPPGPASADAGAAWSAVFANGDLLAAIAPLDCVVHLSCLDQLDAALLAKMPPARVLLALDSAALDQPASLERLGALQQAGYRILIDGALRDGVAVPVSLRAVANDCAAPIPIAAPLVSQFGPHLAYRVDTQDQFDAAGRAGFTWFCGAHARLAGAAEAAAADNDGTTSRRLLKLLGLLLADAGTRDIEIELKQDPALSYQLLRLVNSAAFAPATPVHHFAQAIDRLGRRQLLRWLQLLMYARPRADGAANPLLPIAALRAAQVESLCKQRGYDREAQDLAFQVGVFSLLDVLLGTPMSEIVATLHLPAEPALALLARQGVMGGLLALAEADAPSAGALASHDVTPSQWWSSQLDGFHWAIQVSRNL